VLAFMLLFTACMTIAQRWALARVETYLTTIRQAGRYGMLTNALPEDARLGYAESFIQYRRGMGAYDEEGEPMRTEEFLPGDVVSVTVIRKEFDRLSARENGHICVEVQAIDETRLRASLTLAD